MRIPLDRGRFLNPHDTHENPAAVLIDQAAALRYWPHADPVGAFARLGAPTGDRVQVVGVVGDVRNKGLNELPVPEFYIVNDLFPANPMFFVVRSPRPQENLVPDLRRAILAIDPVQPIYGVRTMGEVVQTSLTLQRISSSMMAIFAFVALLLATLPAWRATLLSPMVAIRDDSHSVWQSTRRGVQQILHRPAAISRSSDTHAVADATLLSDFISATRHAASFEEALRSALGMLCQKLDAASAMLLENVAGLAYRPLAAVPPETALSGDLPAHGFLSNRLRFYALPLPITPADLRIWQRWAAENRPHYLPELEALAKTQARVAVALRTQTEMLGLLLLGAPVNRSEYSAFEMRLLRSCAEQFALTMENARLTQRVVAQEKLQRDIALAAEVQRRLLPDHFPQTSMASLAAHSIPARSVGVDYYDFFDMGDHRIGIALADVAGQGIAAALVMSVVQASLRIISAEGGISLPQLAAKLNRYLYRSTRSNSYATFFYARSTTAIANSATSTPGIILPTSCARPMATPHPRTPLHTLSSKNSQPAA